MVIVLAFVILALMAIMVRMPTTIIMLDRIHTVVSLLILEARFI